MRTVCSSSRLSRGGGSASVHAGIPAAPRQQTPPPDQASRPGTPTRHPVADGKNRFSTCSLKMGGVEIKIGEGGSNKSDVCWNVRVMMINRHNIFFVCFFFFFKLNFHPFQLTLPPWPLYRRKPLNWQKARPQPEDESSSGTAPSPNQPAGGHKGKKKKWAARDYSFKMLSWESW